MHQPTSHHVYRVTDPIEHATQCAQRAAMAARRDGLTESECADVYAFTYALTISEAVA